MLFFGGERLGEAHLLFLSTLGGLSLDVDLAVTLFCRDDLGVKGELEALLGQGPLELFSIVTVRTDQAKQ